MPLRQIFFKSAVFNSHDHTDYFHRTLFEAQFSCRRGSALNHSSFIEEGGDATYVLSGGPDLSGSGAFADPHRNGLRRRLPEQLGIATAQG